MAGAEGSRTFQATGEAYDNFMGRYSKQLAKGFADYALPAAGGRFLDVGCGPGALTGEAVRRLGAESVAAVDPTPGFADTCRERFGIDVRVAPAESLPFADDEFDGAAAQLVFHFVSDPDRALAEMSRVVKPGGLVAAATWDLAGGMEMLRAFWDAAKAVDPAAPDEANTPFSSAGKLHALFTRAGLDDVDESSIVVEAGYSGFDELWANFRSGVGPAGAYAVARPPAEQSRLRDALFHRLGEPHGAFSIPAKSLVARARVPAHP